MEGARVWPAYRRILRWVTWSLTAGWLFVGSIQLATGGDAPALLAVVPFTVWGVWNEVWFRRTALYSLEGRLVAARTLYRRSWPVARSAKWYLQSSAACGLLGGGKPAPANS